MRAHFAVLAVGSVLFLAALIQATSDVFVGSSDPGAAALRNTASLLRGLQLIGLYAAFAALVLGHGLLPRKARATTEDAEPGAAPDRRGR